MPPHFANQGTQPFRTPASGTERKAGYPATAQAWLARQLDSHRQMQGSPPTRTDLPLPHAAEPRQMTIIINLAIPRAITPRCPKAWPQYRGERLLIAAYFSRQTTSICVVCPRET